MSDCCRGSAENSIGDKSLCPVCGNTSKSVLSRTVSLHLQHPWHHLLANEGYHFCDTASCKVIYFSSQQTFDQGDIRTPVGAKSLEPSALLCYCYGVTRADYAQDVTVKDYVAEQTKQGLCACVTSNPSGKCCLKDFL